MLTTVHALVAELSARSSLIANMNLASTVQDSAIEGEPFNLANQPAELSKVAQWVELAVNKGGLSLIEAEIAVRAILGERNFYGTYCELGAYGWLAEHGVEYKAQVALNSSQVLKANGSTIDGHFTDIDAYFDIKGMGFQEYVADLFREKIEAQLAGFVVKIDGPMDVSVKDIEQYAFPQIPSIVIALQNGGSKKIDQLGWVVSALPPAPILTAIATLDPYRLAQENRYFPFKTAGQFTRSFPFFLVFAYASKFNRSLSLNFARSTDITLRSMARRVFMEHSNNSTSASQFDSSVVAGVTLGDASRLLSAMLFICLDDGDAQIFLNPRASNMLNSTHVQQLFDFAPPISLLVDDFAFDNY